MRRDRDREGPFVEDHFTSGDFLQGLFLGTREALYEKGRQSITLTVEEVSAQTVGLLIALYERAVGFYASLVNVNAYHQPGVEAGKKAAGETLQLLAKINGFLKDHPNQTYTAESLSTELGLDSHTESVFKLLDHMASNHRYGLKKEALDPFYISRYSYVCS